RVRKDTTTHQDRWLAIDPDTCALIATYLDEVRAELAAVGVELRDDAYLFSNVPAHARPWNPDWVTHQIAAAADAAGVARMRAMILEALNGQGAAIRRADSRHDELGRAPGDARRVHA